ncbi:DUF1127 domain-containing protein [uncultured Pelagimonas sp.]|uniref:DUF1127 domain-containing protein n=1 Tax=uncultured Pelagimonas sp. TaxID=1618102 RepID=UPI00260CA30E|nr:DUF1127 domain-containing protein [uncultured Pelagimonas sp.]
MIRVATGFAPTKSLRPLTVLRKWFATAEQRHSLANLDAAALDDIGVSATQAQSEAARPFWDAPDHWSK